MSFVQKNLSTNEKIVYSTTKHWYIYLRGIFLIVLGLIIAAGTANPESETNAIVGILVFVGVIVLINALLSARSSEFVVTNKRVILKTGILKRQLVELQLNRSEGLSITQGIMGRIFNFGNIRITSGGVTEAFSKIARPYEFKKQINNAIEGSFTVAPNSSFM